MSQTKEHQLWRELAIQRLGGKCGKCGTTDNLEIHHRDSNHENNDPSNLQLLCRTHHRQAPHISRGRAKIITGNRITIPASFARERGLQVGEFCEIEDYTKDPEHPKFLVTFFKVGTR